MIRIGNRVTERDVREDLTRRGYHGRTAKFEELELAAIERPGWIQVFRFEVHVSDEDDNRHHFYGVVRDDERNQTEIRYFDTPDAQQQHLKSWSGDMILREYRPRTRAEKILLGVFVSLVVILAAFTVLVKGL